MLVILTFSFKKLLVPYCAMRPQIARSAGWPKELQAEGWETLDVLMENCENPMSSWENPMNI